MKIAFSESEYSSRLKRAKHALNKRQIDGCICVAPENLYYLTGFDGHTYWSDQAAIFTTDDQNPTLIIRDTDYGIALETSWVPDVRTYHYSTDDSAALMRTVIEEKGLLGKRIGLDLQAFALPTAKGIKLIEKLKPAKIVDSTNIIGTLRVVKSEAEIAYVREAAKYANAGMAAAIDSIEVGKTEIQIAAEIEYAIRSRGSDSPAMPTWMSSGANTAYSHFVPTNRVIESGDLVSFSFAGVARRYHCTMYKVVSTGDPPPRVKEVYKAAIESVEAGMNAAAVGAPVSTLEEEALQPLKEKNLDKYFAQRFGYGVSAGYPPSWLEPLDITRGSSQRLEAGMVFCLHCVLKLPNEGFGIMVGGDFILHDDRLEFLDQTGLELRII